MIQVYENNRSKELRRERRRRAARRQRRKYLLAGGVLLLTMMLIRVRAGSAGEAGNVNPTKAQSRIENVEPIRVQGKTESVISVSAKADKKEARRIWRENEELLILVNKEHALPQDYQPSLRSICKGRLQAAEVLYDDLVAMLADAGKEGYQFYFASAYRSADYQQKLIDGDIRKKMKEGESYEQALNRIYRQVMPSGYSEHETGLALDLLASGNENLDKTQETCPGNQWLREHCMEYGFILRYPKEKEAETGIDYEPWHFRYVGKEAAKYLSENNLTLEEFWELVSEKAE